MNRPLPILVLCALLSSAAAFAHEVTASPALAPMTPTTSVTLDIHAAGFNFPGGRGRYSTQTLSAEYVPFPLIGFFARLPTHFITQDFRPPVRFGLGDISLGSEVRVLGDGVNYVVTVATTLEMPTGDSTSGFGAGHYAVIPELAGGFSAAGFKVNGRVGGEVGVGRSGTAVPVNFVNPHSDREFFTQLTVGYAFSYQGLVFLGVDSAHPRTGPEFGQSSLRGMLGLILAPSYMARIGVSAAVPLVGPHRYEWKVLVTTQLRFPVEE
jgi:hypothetical protein